LTLKQHATEEQAMAFARFPELANATTLPIDNQETLPPQRRYGAPNAVKSEH
jgi:hypothetical protein